MRKYLTLLCLILCLVVGSSALSESIALETCSIELYLPDNWICVNSNNVQYLDAAYDFISEYVSIIKDSVKTIVVVPSEMIMQSLIQGYEKLKGTPLQGMLAFAG